jgi:hypothetical protein
MPNLRRDNTSAGFISGNPVLAAGEHGYETDTEASKIGDGVTPWGSLPYTAPNLSSAALTGALSDTGYDVILLAGQSNMSGRGIPSTPYLDPAHPRVFQLKGKNPNKGTVIPAADPLDMVDAPTGIGPGFQFARQYIKAGYLSYSRKILLVPVAEGGVPLTRTATPTWKPSVTGSDYSNMIAQANAALALPGSRLVAVLWVQGETDGDLSATGAAYQADFDSLITGVRALTGTGVTTAPFIIGGMVSEYLGTGTRAAINAVHADTPNRKAQTAFVAGPTGAELGDGNHYNRQGQIALAASMFTAFSQLAANVPGNRFGTYTTDAFSTDSTTLVGRNTDAVNGGGSAVWSASTANAAFAASGGSLVRGASVTSQFAGTPVPNTKQRVSLKLTTLPAGGGQVYLMARADTVAAANCYRLVIFDTGNVQLQKNVAGSGTNLTTTYAAAVVAGSVISLDCDGTNISLMVDGAVIGSPIVDSTFTRAGWAGVGIGTTVTSVTLDDFKIESVL